MYRPAYSLHVLYATSISSSWDRFVILLPLFKLPFIINRHSWTGVVSVIDGLKTLPSIVNYFVARYRDIDDNMRILDYHFLQPVIMWRGRALCPPLALRWQRGKALITFGAISWCLSTLKELTSFRRSVWRASRTWRMRRLSLYVPVQFRAAILAKENNNE